MEFVLPVPECRASPILYLEDCVHLAGGWGADEKVKSSFYKMNLLTGEVSILRDLRKQCGHGIIVPPRTP